MNINWISVIKNGNPKSEKYYKEVHTNDGTENA
jgi:hypothetical protein